MRSSAGAKAGDVVRLVVRERTFREAHRDEVPGPRRLVRQVVAAALEVEASDLVGNIGKHDEFVLIDVLVVRSLAIHRAQRAYLLLHDAEEVALVGHPLSGTVSRQG